MKEFLFFLSGQLLIFSFLFNLSCLAAVVLSIASTCIWYALFYFFGRFRLFPGVRFVASWVGWEVIKDRVLGGLPWGDLYSFFGGVFPVNQVASFLPPYAISVLALAVAMTAINALITLDHRWVKRFLMTISLSLALGLLGWGWAFFSLSTKRSVGRSLSVCLFQTAIPNLDKRRVEEANQIWKTYTEFVKEHAPKDIDLLILPETMAIFSWPEEDLVRYLKKWQEGDGIPYLILGVNRLVGNKYFNSALLYGPSKVDLYSKQKLVPFGEYIPSALGPLAQWLSRHISVLSSGGYSPGRGFRIFEVRGVKILPLICYEDSFYYFLDRAMKTLPERVDAVVVLSNDDWFGKGLAQFFHLSLARLQAIRHRVWIVKVNNDGFSCVIDPYGRVVLGSVSWNNLGHRKLVCGIIKF